MIIIKFISQKIARDKLGDSYFFKLNRELSFCDFILLLLFSYWSFYSMLPLFSFYLIGLRILT